MAKVRRGIAAVLGSAAIVSCSWGMYDGSYSGGPDDGGIPGVGDAANTSLGGAGGMVRSSDGFFVIEVPPGAIPGPVAFSITQGIGGAGVGKTYNVSTRGLVGGLQKHVTVLFQDPSVRATSPSVLSVTLESQPLAGGGTNSGGGPALLVYGFTTRIEGNFGLLLTAVPTISNAACPPGCDQTCANVNCGSSTCTTTPCGCQSPMFQTCYGLCRKSVSGGKDVDACDRCAISACKMVGGVTVSTQAPMGSHTCLCINNGRKPTSELLACADKGQLATSCVFNDMPEGGAPSDGTLITCRNSPPCRTADQTSCCVVTSTCVPRFDAGACPAPPILQCDEAANCPGGQSCCGDGQGNARCEMQCFGGSQFCRLHSECPNGKACVIVDSPNNQCRVQICEGSATPVFPAGCM